LAESHAPAPTPAAAPQCPSGTHTLREHLLPWKVKKAKELMIRLMIQGCSVAGIARECAMSRSHFTRSFKNATGMSPHGWLQREKVRKAEELIRSGTMSMCQVAQECGFSDQAYFTRVFGKLNGVSPKRWQLQHLCQQATALDGQPLNIP
jgi:transcriptional regulator GlxA family with amidase domain